MMKKLFTILISLFVVGVGFAQNEANIWHFPSQRGMDFNTGVPVLISGPSKNFCSSVMSDTAGNLLFSADSYSIYNCNLIVMQNGEDVAGYPSEQSCLIAPKPGSDKLYYVFTVGSSSVTPPAYGLYYSLVDMTLDNGLGAVTSEKNILLNSAINAVNWICGVRHTNEKDIWIITYLYNENRYAAFLLTENGIEDNPVISNTMYRPPEKFRGGIAVSFNKKYLISAFTWGGIPAEPYKSCDVCKFDATTGEINFLYELELPDIEGNRGPMSVAFSPDSKLAYITYYHTLNGHYLPLSI